MPDRPRSKTDVRLLEGPPSSGEYIRPRLKAEHKVTPGWTIRVSSVTVNPRVLTFKLTGPRGASRTIRAEQDYATSFIAIIELDDWREYYFNPEVEPKIASYVLAAVDIQFPLGPLGANHPGTN